MTADDTREGLLHFLNANPNPTGIMLTEEALNEYLSRPPVFPAPRHRSIVMHPNRAIWFEVSTRAGSTHAVRKPWRQRLRSAWSAFTYHDEYEGHEWDWRYALTRLRIKTTEVLTDEAKREIEWRIAERRASSPYTYGVHITQYTPPA